MVMRSGNIPPPSRYMGQQSDSLLHSSQSAGPDSPAGQLQGQGWSVPRPRSMLLASAADRDRCLGTENQRLLRRRHSRGAPVSSGRPFPSGHGGSAVGEACLLLGSF